MRFCLPHVVSYSKDKDFTLIFKHFWGYSTFFVRLQGTGYKVSHYSLSTYLIIRKLSCLHSGYSVVMSLVEVIIAVQYSCPRIFELSRFPIGVAPCGFFVGKVDLRGRIH